MKTLGVLTFLSSVGLFIGQTMPDPITPWATSSAAVTLGLLTSCLLMRTIPSLLRANTEARRDLTSARATFQETLDKIADRHERWESLRHTDSSRLNNTLRKMSVTCARMQARKPNPHEPEST